MCKFFNTIGDTRNFLTKNLLSGWKRALHQRKISRLISNEISLDVQSPISPSLWHVTAPVSHAEVNLGINPETNFPTVYHFSVLVHISDLYHRLREFFSKNSAKNCVSCYLSNEKGRGRKEIKKEYGTFRHVS